MAIVAGVGIFAVGRSSGTPNPCAVAPLTNASIIAYLDPSFPPASVCKVARSADKALTEKGLPFTVTSDTANHVVILTPTKVDRYRIHDEVIAAGTLVRRMPQVLGVEAANTRASAPFCGTVPSARMDSSTRAVADALVRLHLGERALDYYIRSTDMKVTLNELLIQLRLDRAFLEKLRHVRLPGLAAADRRRFQSDRTIYDATLTATARSLHVNDQAAASRTVLLLGHQRDISGGDLDALRADLSFRSNTCGFLSP